MSELLEDLIDTVEGVIRIADDRGDGSARTLARRLAAARNPAPVRNGYQHELHVAHDVWMEHLSRGLLPKVLRDVLVTLRRCRDRRGLPEAEDPWLPIDRRRFQARKDIVRAELQPEMLAALRACRLYEGTRKVSHLSEAVRTVEGACRMETARLHPRPLPEMCESETACLGRALRAHLPASAFRFFVGKVRAAVVSSSRHPRRPGQARRSDEDQWFSLPSWVVDGEDRWTDGHWFEPSFQAEYARIMAAARREEEAYERRRAENRRMVEEWQARRDEEARQAASAAEEDFRQPLRTNVAASPGPVPDPGWESRIPMRMPFAGALMDFPHGETVEEMIQRRIREDEEVQKAWDRLKSLEEERRREEIAERARRAPFEARRRAKESPLRIQGRSPATPRPATDWPPPMGPKSLR